MKTKFNADELNLFTLAKKYSNETKARKLFELWRWPGGSRFARIASMTRHTRSNQSPARKTKPVLAFIVAPLAAKLLPQLSERLWKIRICQSANG
jgi:hypothetical protein